MNPKRFWRSKTIIAAAIMLITFVLDAAFALGISDTVNEQLNSVFVVNEMQEVIKINWTALITLASMIAMRFLSKKPIKPIVGGRNETHIEKVLKKRRDEL